MPDLSTSSARVFNGVQLVQTLCKSFWFCRSALTSFVAASLAVYDACNVEETRHGSL